MSEISRLASNFEKRSKSEAERIEKSVRSAFTAHEKALRQELKNAEKRTADAIRDHNRNLSKLLLRSWIAVLITVLLVGLVSAGLLWWTGQQIASNAAEIQSQRQSLDRLAEQGSRIELSRCGESRTPCVAIKPDSGRYSGSDGTIYMIPRGY